MGGLGERESGKERELGAGHFLCQDLLLGHSKSRQLSGTCGRGRR